MSMTFSEFNEKINEKANESQVFELVPNDLNACVARLPKDLRKLMRGNPDLFLAGGFIRSIVSGERVSDYDFFGPSQAKLLAWAEEVATFRNAMTHKTPNAVTVITPFKPSIQFILRWHYDNPEALLDGFDFTVCQAVLWYSTGKWHSAVSPHFYPDLAAKRLVYLNPIRDEAPGGSMLRVRKFLKRGYNIQVLALAGVMSRVYQAVKDESGVEVEKVIAGLLREVDPLVVSDDIEPGELEPFFPSQDEGETD